MTSERNEKLIKSYSRQVFSYSTRLSHYRYLLLSFFVWNEGITACFWYHHIFSQRTNKSFFFNFSVHYNDHTKTIQRYRIISSILKHFLNRMQYILDNIRVVQNHHSSQYLSRLLLFFCFLWIKHFVNWLLSFWVTWSLAASCFARIVCSFCARAIALVEQFLSSS